LNGKTLLNTSGSIDPWVSNLGVDTDSRDESNEVVGELHFDDDEEGGLKGEERRMGGG
jgi:hypothetical protein